jgi:hypothetical protein
MSDMGQPIIKTLRSFHLVVSQERWLRVPASDREFHMHRRRGRTVGRIVVGAIAPNMAPKSVGYRRQNGRSIRLAVIVARGRMWPRALFRSSAFAVPNPPSPTPAFAAFDDLIDRQANGGRLNGPLLA